MSKCVSWKKKWIRMKAWCLELDGRQDRDECAKPIVGCGTGPAVDPVAVFSLVRFQETEMIKDPEGKDCPGSSIRDTTMTEKRVMEYQASLMPTGD
jgi:hypothetical protein